MNLAALSGAAIIALASTMIFLLVVKSLDVLSAPTLESSRFPKSIMFEAAQRFRDEMERLGREQSHYVFATAVFAVIFVITYLLPPQKMFEALPTWQLILVLVIFFAAVSYALFRLVKIVIAKRRLAFVRDANIATGHSLQKLTANQNRVFHDVPCGPHIIDNVIVGLQGIYAISVIARVPGKDNRVRLRDHELSFAPGKETVSVARSGQKSRDLAKELGKLLQHDVRVRSVIAVPGWEIESQTSDDYLVVNERNLAMLSGWKDQKDFLMTEDVAHIHQLLTKRCTRFG